MKYFSLSLIALSLLLHSCNSAETTSSENKIERSSEFLALSAGFKDPADQYRPETWFHLMGNNITREGLTADLEAVKRAGLQGIHLFNKSGGSYPNVEPVKILSPEWEDMIRHAADECERLGLKFTMQNCPGWSMTGGPWVPVEEAQREVVETTYRIDGGKEFSDVLELNPLYETTDYDYQDIQLIAFPTLEGDNQEAFNPARIESNNELVPWKDIFDPSANVIVEERSTQLDLPLDAYREKGISKVDNKDSWVTVGFKEPITLRSIVLPAMRHIILDNQYPRVDVSVKVQAVIDDKLTDVVTIKIPDINWSDRQIFQTLAIPETTSEEFTFTFEGSHAIAPESIRLYAKPRLHNHEAKAAKAMRILEKDVMFQFSENTIIDSEEIIDLSEIMAADGKLNWNVPEGDWTVVRFGHINMRRTNKPAVPEATGWEASKLDKEAIENHLRNGMIGNLIKDGGPIGDGKLHGLLIDSWESFIPTWTMNSEDLFNEFEQRRGYSMKPYMPATMGYIVNSVESTTKFLRDLRNTMDGVYIDNFFNHFATVAHDMGAKVYTEGAGGEVLPIDPMRYYGVSDIPMTEFWYPKAPSNQNEYAKPIYSAASAMHLYNKPFLAAEACTQLGVQWNEHPFSVKYLIDYNFTKGVNHLVFHTFSHTPQMDVYPGSTFGGHIGFPLVRNQTWWKYMKDWTDYLARNQYVLQQGEYAADVLWYIGDHFERPPYDLDYFPDGYRFDFLNAELLHEKLSVENGNIHVENAGNYRVIMLKDSKSMLLSTAKKLKELVLAGAVILGDRPTDSPSLMDNDTDLKELKNIADEMWGATENGVKQVGQGKVYWGKSLEDVLQAESISKDVIVPKQVDVNWIHRKTADADIYFVASKMDEPVDVALSFRQTGVVPQIWDGLTGEQFDAKIWSRGKERTNVTLSLPSSGSAIVVFTKGDKVPYGSKLTRNNNTVLDSKTGWYQINETEEFMPIVWKEDTFYAFKAGEYEVHRDSNTELVQMKIDKKEMNDDWVAGFEAGWDTPETIQMDALKSLTKHQDKAVQHYSGTTTYYKSFSHEDEGKHVTLDLGKVENIAELWCNGKKVGVKWAPPFIFDVSDAIQEGENNVEIKVTNTWRNQLIFDNTRPKAQKKTWTSNPPNKEETNLETAGLIGPVVLRTHH
ncbi:MAG: glycosyl hydrolase [Leeuwenhoekiella sp.]